MAIAGLEALDGQLLDGLVFCAQAYAAFDRIRSSPRGIEELRMLTSQRSKKMVEEILPLVLRCSGADVQHRGIPRRQFIEVTTAVHANDYLVREHLNKEGFAFAPRGTRRDPKTRAIASLPSVYSYRQPQAELVGLISERIAAKAQKRCPQPTSLLIT